ncbi:MAG: transglutaminaseTgpA domain-containing protein [Propioniciclava sp.]
MNRPDRVRLALAAALIGQLVPWRSLTTDVLSLIWAATAVALVAGAGKLGALVGRNPLPTQILLAVATVAVSIGLSHGWSAVLAAGSIPAAVVQSAHSAAPLPPSVGGTVIVVGIWALAAVLGEALAVATRHVWVAALPVLTPYVILAVALPPPARFSEFALAAAGVVLVLVAAAPTGSRIRSLRTALVAIGVTALALALTWAIVGLLPTLSVPIQRAPVQMNDPSLDLKRNLVRGSDEVIIQYTTDPGSPTRLRLATLPRFTSNGFGLQNVALSAGPLPDPPGLDRPGEGRTTTVTAVGFASEWLPVPYAPRQVEVEGTWGHTVDTLDILSLAERGRESATLGLTYAVESLDVAPTGAEVADARTSLEDGRDSLVELPDEVNPEIRELADTITEGATTDGAAAQAIETYLRSDRFSYDLSVRYDGDSLETLDDFLFGSRSGYCEQFAGAMAVLARAEGIPSRVVVGFTSGTVTEEGTWNLTERDMHAWPELWLDGWGWVAFEPTPAAGSGVSDAEVPGDAEVSPSPQPSQEPAPASPLPLPSPSTSATPEAEVDESGAATTGTPWAWALVALLVVAGGLLVWGWPRLTRRIRRRARLRGSGDARADALAVWAEIGESVSDAGLVWPPGSPRYAAAELTSTVAEEKAQQALDRLAIAAERALYDHSEAEPPAVAAEDVWIVLDAIAMHGRETQHPRRAQR